jgi:hypothetical protein
MPEPSDMEGPVEREEALAAKELRKPKQLPPNGFALRLETVENLSRWNAPILGNYLVAFGLSGRTDIPNAAF